MRNKLKITHTWHLHGKLKNLTILEKNKKEREEDKRKEQRGLLLYSSIKSIVFS
jgi:hypothetical protein